MTDNVYALMTMNLARYSATQEPFTGGKDWLVGGVRGERGKHARTCSLVCCKGVANRFTSAVLLAPCGLTAVCLPPPSDQTPCYELYRTSDGHISVGALEPKFWSAFCRAIERPDLIDLQFPDGPRELARVKEEVQKVMATRTDREWKEFFRTKDCCVEVGRWNHPRRTRAHARVSL